MADVVLTVQTIASAGITPTFTGSLSVSNTYKFRNTGTVWLHFKKTGAGVAAITVQTPATQGGLAVAEQTFNVPATTGEIVAGPFPKTLYNDAANDAAFTSSDIAGLSVAILSL